MVVKIERHRYLQVRFFGVPPTKKELNRDIRNSASIMFGQLFVARSALHVIECLDAEAIIRCTHDARDQVEAALELIKSSNYCLRVVKVSGTLKSLSKNLIDPGD